MMEIDSETQELCLNVNGEKFSTEERSHNYSWRLRVALYVILLLAGETMATLLGRLYYEKGGKSTWLETLVQLVPLTFPCYCYIKPEPSKTKSITKETTSFLTLSLVYIGIGLVVAGQSGLYSLGLLNLPVSTFSLISASQLAFNAVFSYFLNSQKFTPYILNSLVLLTLSSTLLVIQHEPESSSMSLAKYNYVVGYICAFGSSAGYSLTLSLIDYAFESSSVPQSKNYKKWFRISIYVFFVLSCQALSTILGRLYYESGGKSTWMGTLVQLIGFPVLFLCRFFSRIKTPKSTDADFRQLHSFTVLASIYIVTGLLVSANSYMSSVGLLYLPVSTFSLILASQLAFTAIFSYFLNSQKFTPFIVNSLFLLTISSALLVVNTDSENTDKVSRVKYVIGIICTIGASAGIGLLLSLVQLILRKFLKKQTFSTVMDLVAYQSLVASCMVLIGLFASGEWKTLTSEMENYKLGKAPYILTLASIAISWQVYTIGVVGLIFESSSVFSNSITAVGLPIVPVVAVIVFHDKMNTSKIFSYHFSYMGLHFICLSALPRREKVED